MKYQFLEPIQIGSQTVKNRVVFLAMAKMFSGFDGVVSDRDVAYIASVAKGGVGLIIPGAMVIDPEWPSVIPMQMMISSDAFLPGLKRLADAAHENGAKILFQLWHPGAVNYSGKQPPTIDELTTEQIHSIQQKFHDCAKRAIAAGADGVEFQMCHTYLANQFLSPLFNHRTDEYGLSTLENQLRFSVETLSLIRSAIGPDKILAVKLQGTDCREGGITPEMAATFAPYVEKAGADMISVSGGGSLTDITGMSGDGTRAEGWKVPAAKLVKSVVKIPVCATGSIRHPEFASQIIQDGDCDLIGMGRGIYAENEWVKKCAEGREKEMRYCISCMNCWNTNMAPHQSGCSVNPFAGREYEKPPLKIDGNDRVVVIVGAGPAGLEAAVTLKQRGFHPIVLEKSSRIGGNINLAKMPPNKGKLQWAVDYYENMIQLLDIDVRYNTEATADLVASLHPYSVLIAAGSKANALSVPGLEQCEVHQSRDVLEQEMSLTGRAIVVIGGGLVGIETALYLRARDNEVSIVDFAPAPSLNQLDAMNFTMEGALEYGHCLEQGIRLYYRHKVHAYKNGALYVESVESGETVQIPANVVILSAGRKPNSSLYDELIARGLQRIYKVGDANVCDKIVRAVQNGSKYAYALK